MFYHRMCAVSVSGHICVNPEVPRACDNKQCWRIFVVWISLYIQTVTFSQTKDVAIRCDVTKQPFQQNAAFLLLFEERFAWNDTARSGSIDIDDFNAECLDFTSPRDFCFAEEDEEFYPSPCFRCSGGSSCELWPHTSNGDRKLAEQKAGAIVEGYEVYIRH